MKQLVKAYHPYQQLVNGGAAELHAYVDEVCDRVEEVDGEILALMDDESGEARRKRLHKEADLLLLKFPTLESRPPLFGALFGVKDIYRVDGFETRAGSALPASLFAGEEASCVSKLKASGALVLGKTVTTEFAYFEPGPTKNPHDLRRTPGGSSSGSAAAVAAGLCCFALGTQTAGSIIRPAAFCGVVGFKPSYNRINAKGLVAFAPSLDHVGYFTQTVRTATNIAPVLLDDYREIKSKKPVLAVPALKTGSYFDGLVDAEALKIFEASVEKLENKGFTVKRLGETFQDLQEYLALHRHLMAFEIAEVHKDWYKPHERLYRSRTKGLIDAGLAIADADAAKKGQAVLRKHLEDLMDLHDVDCFISPSAPGVPPEGLSATGDPSVCMPWTYSGLPAISLPCGSLDDMPLAIQLAARYYHDEALLAYAQIIEDALLESSST